MKILIDTGKFTPTENSILVFKDNKWELTTRQEYLSYQDKILLLQSKKIDELEEEIKKYESEINTKINTMAKSIKTLLGD